MLFSTRGRYGLKAMVDLALEYGQGPVSAAALAQKVIAAPAFEPVADEVLEEAERVMRGCERVICCREKFGSYEAMNEKLLAYARECGTPMEQI